MPNLVSLTCPSLQILEKTEYIHKSYFHTYFRNCHNSKTNYKIDMKLGPVTKIDKRNKAMFKKINDDVHVVGKL